MTVFLVCCSICMGAGLTAGMMFVPDMSIMWLASPAHSMIVWREAIVFALSVAAVASVYFDMRWLRFIWAVAAVMLGWQAVAYFLNNPVYILDAMFMMGAAINFAIIAMTVAREPELERVWRPQWSRQTVVPLRMSNAMYVFQNTWAFLVRLPTTLAISMRLVSAAWLPRRHLR